MCTVYAAHALGIITRSLVRTITYHKENCVCIKKTQNKVEVDKHRVDTTDTPAIYNQGLESDDVTLVLKLGLSTRQDSRTVQIVRLPGPDTIKSE